MSYPLPTLSNDFYQTLKPCVFIGKQRAYIEIPAFSVDYELKTAPYIFAVFQYAASRDFVLTSITPPLEDINYVICIKYRLDDGTVGRYKLWYDPENDVLHQVDAYSKQLIKKNFTIELWSTEIASASVLEPAGFDEIFYNEEQECEFNGMIQIEAGTVWSYVSQEDANQRAVAYLVCPPEPDTPDPEFSPELDGLRFEIPCGACSLYRDPEETVCAICSCENPVDQVVTLVADSGKLYNVLLGFIGFFELSNAIIGGQRGDATQPFFAKNATVLNDPSGFNLYSLIVSNPAATYYLNKGTGASQNPQLFSYTATIQMQGDSTVTLRALTRDNNQLANWNSIVVPGIEPAPLPYDGQLMQISVIQITEV